VRSMFLTQRAGCAASLGKRCCWPVRRGRNICHEFSQQSGHGVCRHLDLQIHMLAEQETTEILRLLRALCEHSRVPLTTKSNGRAFEEETHHADILRQIDGAIEHRVEEIAHLMVATANGSQVADASESR
jgi:hypothetical protein